jgi:hypothetical protein
MPLALRETLRRYWPLPRREFLPGKPHPESERRRRRIRPRPPGRRLRETRVEADQKRQDWFRHRERPGQIVDGGLNSGVVQQPRQRQIALIVSLSCRFGRCHRSSENSNRNAMEAIRRQFRCIAPAAREQLPYEDCESPGAWREAFTCSSMADMPATRSSVVSGPNRSSWCSISRAATFHDSPAAWYIRKSG